MTREKRGREKRAATVETAKNPRTWRTEEIWLLREIYPCLPDEVAERLERHTAEDVASLAFRLNLKKLPRPAEGGEGTDAAVPPEAPWSISYDERTFAEAWERSLLAQARYGKYSLASMEGGMDEREDDK